MLHVRLKACAPQFGALLAVVLFRASVVLASLPVALYIVSSFVRSASPSFPPLTISSEPLLPDLMAAAIAWLVRTILATLQIDKLDAWIRRVGLADDVEKLRSEIKRVKMVVSAVKVRGIANEALDESFPLLVERLYEAEDVVDELDYYRLQEQVQGGTPAASLPADPSVYGTHTTPCRSYLPSTDKLILSDEGRP